MTGRQRLRRLVDRIAALGRRTSRKKVHATREPVVSRRFITGSLP